MEARITKDEVAEQLAAMERQANKLDAIHSAMGRSILEKQGAIKRLRDEVCMLESKRTVLIAEIDRLQALCRALEVVRDTVCDS